MTQVGNLMDQDSDGTQGEIAGDTYATPRSLTRADQPSSDPRNGPAFTLPYDRDTLPMIIAGPQVVAITVAGQPASPDNTVVNPQAMALAVTLPNAVAPANFTAASIDGIFNSTGQPVAGPFTIIPVYPAGTTSGPTNTYRIGLPAQVAPGTYTVDYTAGFAGTAGFATDMQPTPAVVGASAIDITFDRAMDGSTFTVADIIRMNTPIGQIAPNRLTVTQTSPTTFRVFFPPQVLSGPYSIDFGAKISSSAGFELDNNRNAGLGVLRGGDPVSDAIVVNVSTSTPPPPSPTTLPEDDNAILPGQTETFPITVAEDFTISQFIPANRDRTASKLISVRLNLTTANTTNIRLVLISPDGERVVLANGPGNQGAPPRQNFSNTSFDDLAATPISAGSAPFDRGPYLPVDSLGGALDGESTAGTWLLEITNNNTDSTATLQNWRLDLPRPVPGTGLGEAVADRFTAAFRVFNSDPTNALNQQTWTPVGGAAENDYLDSTGLQSSRISAVAVDPSDPSGNTVYLSGASGGVWKSTNFLTQDPVGPQWIPLTDFGPAYSLNIGSIALFPRNNDPEQTVVFALTGEGNTLSAGIGVLRSEDGGKTWKVLDSTNNVDVNGNVLPVASAQRNRTFFGATGFKIIVDPTPTPQGEVVVYMAVQGNAAQQGVWRSFDSGDTWFRIRAGQADDIVLAPGSGGTTIQQGPFLQTLFATFRGEGVFVTTSAPAAASLTLMAGDQGTPSVRNVDPNSGTNNAVIVQNLINPNGNRGRITLATPAFANTIENTFYRNWLYALVSTPAGNMDGLYVTKDLGNTWTKVQLPVYTPGPGFGGLGYGSNDESLQEIDLFGGRPPLPGQGNYNNAIAVDPTDPNTVYIAGLGAAGLLPIRSSLKVDLTNLGDAHAFVFDDFSDPTGTNGPAIGGGEKQLRIFPGESDFFPSDFINLLRHPLDPLNQALSSTLQIETILDTGTPRPTTFTNQGDDVRFQPFNEFFSGFADVHQIVPFIDPLTNRVRFIYALDQGVYTGVDAGDGTVDAGIGTATSVTGPRNGNLQLSQFYAGAVQPSQLAADIAGALFYGFSQDNGAITSRGDLLATGDLSWVAIGGDASGGVTDQTGSGSAFKYFWPCCGATIGGDLGTDFFRYFAPGSDHVGTSGTIGVSRTFGLIQAGDNPGADIGQWPLISADVGYPAINPINGDALVMSSEAGRVFLTTNAAQNWVPIGEPGQLDGTIARALAFGAPNPANPQALNNFIYAGTLGGNVFVTTNSGGVWRNISNGLDGSSVMQIVSNPRRGSTDAYAVTRTGVFYLPDANAVNPAWVNITTNLFTVTRPVFGDNADRTAALRPGTIATIAADWRFANPVPGNAVATFPVLYVAGEGGVFRSTDQGQTWTIFPDMTNVGAPEDGGYLPFVEVTDLDLALGDIDPVSGLPKQDGGLNMLVASTYGRGTWAIRLDPTLPNNVVFQSGPRVTDVVPSSSTSTPGSTDRLTLTFAGPVDPTTFTPADVTLFAPNGDPITITDVVMTSVPNGSGQNPRNVFELRFAPQTAVGTYNLTVGPNISDTSGNLMNQNGNQVNGEPGADAFTASLLLNSTATVGGIRVEGLDATLTAGQQDTVTIRATDGSGNTLTGYTGQVRVSAPNDTMAIYYPTPGNPSPLPAIINVVNGVATITVEFRTVGNQPLIVTSLDNSLSPQNPPVSTNVVAADVASLSVGVNPTTVQAGGIVQATVTARDQFGNVATNFNGPVTLTSSDPQAQLPPQFTLTNGTATQDVELRTRGSQTITATTTNANNTVVMGTSPAVNVTAGAATQLTVFNPPPTITAGAPVTLRVGATDQFGNVDPAFTGTIVVSTTDGNAIVESGTALGADGSAGEALITLDMRTAGSQNVTFTIQEDPTFTQTITPTVVANQAVRFGVTRNPATVNAGAQVAVTVTAFDSFGNVATGYPGHVRLTVSNDPMATLPAPFALGGDGTEQVLITLRTAGNQTVQATDTTNPGLNGSTTVTVTPGSLAQYTIAGPTTVVTGTPTTYTVRASDAFGNPITGFNGNARISVTDIEATAPGTVSIINGVGTFNATLRTFGDQTISVADLQFSSVTGEITSTVVPVPVPARRLRRHRRRTRVVAAPFRRRPRRCRRTRPASRRCSPWPSGPRWSTGSRWSTRPGRWSTSSPLTNKGSLAVSGPTSPERRPGSTSSPCPARAGRSMSGCSTRSPAFRRRPSWRSRSRSPAGRSSRRPTSTRTGSTTTPSRRTPVAARE